MKKLVFFFIVLPLLVVAQEQKITASFIETIPVDADAFVGFDKFGFSYFIKDNSFIKSQDGKTVEYKNVALGKITRADIQNPLLMVLFYESFNTIILLDNQLNEVRKINFTELNIPIVAHAAGLASQNRIWVYDSLSQQIGLFDYTRNTYLTLSIPFRQNLDYYQTDFNNFRWVDEKGQVYSCDVFGKVIALGKMDFFTAAQFVSDSKILFLGNGKLQLQDWDQNVLYTIAGVDKTFKKFSYAAQILSIFTNGGITNYKITIP